MYYKLKPEYCLRGWQGMAWVLVQRPQNQTRALTRAMFEALLLCDGQTPLSDQSLSPAQQDALKKAEEEGYIQPIETPCPLAPEQYYKYYQNRYVQKVFWSVTGRCNFRCRHCYMDAPDGHLGELSTEEAFRLIDEMAECGVLRVDLSGGEALIRKDFWQLVDRILSHGMTVGQLYSNGWLLNETVLDSLEQRGLHPEFYISYDGADGWHDWMRGLPGAEEAALRAMKLCRDRGFFVGASMCVHRGNLASIPKSVQAVAAAGVRQIKLVNVDETDLWRCHSEGNAMTRPEFIDAMLPFIDWYYQAGKPIPTFLLGGVAALYQDRPVEPYYQHYCGTDQCLDSYLCGAVRWSCYITPEGRLLPCMPMTATPRQEVFPKVQEIGLRQGLSDSYYMRFVNSRIKDLLAVNPECASCEYRYRCGGGCRAVALTTGSQDLMGCDREMCTFWKQGYADRIEQAVQKAREKYEIQT